MCGIIDIENDSSVTIEIVNEIPFIAIEAFSTINFLSLLTKFSKKNSQLLSNLLILVILVVLST